MYSQEEIELWIARGRGDIPSPVSPSASANSARAMVDYNRFYSNDGMFSLENSYSEEDEKYLEEFEKECEEITRQDIEWQKNEIRRLENKIHNMKIIIIVFGLACFAVIVNTLLTLF